MKFKQMKNEQISNKELMRDQKYKEQPDSTGLQWEGNNFSFRLRNIVNNKFFDIPDKRQQTHLTDIIERLEKRNNTVPLVLSIPKPISLGNNQKDYSITLKTEIEERDQDIPLKDNRNASKKIEQKSLERENKEEMLQQSERKRKRIKKQQVKKKETPKIVQEFKLPDDDYTEPLKPFSELRSLLKVLFDRTRYYKTGFVLSMEESSILNAVFLKKFQKDCFFDGSIQTICHYQAQINKKQRKKCEEVYKFVFKTTFKYMKNDFFTKNDLFRRGISKQKRKNEFYQYYFGDLAKSLNKELASFYLPLTPSNWRFESKVKLSKTINHSYISTILQSDVFLKDFRSFFQNKKESFCREMIEEQIDKLIDKWESLYEESDYSLRSIDTIISDIKFNKKCKLPWSMGEAEGAFSEIQRLFPK